MRLVFHLSFSSRLPPVWSLQGEKLLSQSTAISICLMITVQPVPPHIDQVHGSAKAWQGHLPRCCNNFAAYSCSCQGALWLGQCNLMAANSIAERAYQW